MDMFITVPSVDFLCDEECNIDIIELEIVLFRRKNLVASTKCKDIKINNNKSNYIESDNTISNKEIKNNVKNPEENYIILDNRERESLTDISKLKSLIFPSLEKREPKDSTIQNKIQIAFYDNDFNELTDICANELWLTAIWIDELNAWLCIKPNNLCNKLKKKGDVLIEKSHCISGNN